MFIVIPLVISTGVIKMPSNKTVYIGQIAHNLDTLHAKIYWYHLLPLVPMTYIFNTKIGYAFQLVIWQQVIHKI